MTYLNHLLLLLCLLSVGESAKAQVGETYLPLLYVNAPPGSSTEIALPLPGTCNCYEWDTEACPFSLVALGSSDEACIFRFRPYDGYQGNGTDWVRLVSRRGCTSTRFNQVVVFVWNPQVRAGTVGTAQEVGLCGIANYRPFCGAYGTASGNLVCNEGMGGYPFYTLPTPLQRGVLPSWEVLAGQPLWNCINPFELDNGVVDIGSSMPNYSDAIFTNLKPAPRGRRQYLLTYTRAALTGNGLLDSLHVILTNGLVADLEGGWGFEQNPRVKNGTRLFTDRNIAGPQPPQRVAVRTVLNAPPQQLLFWPQQGWTSFGQWGRVTLDQVALHAFPLSDTTTQYSACGSSVALQVPNVSIPANSQWHWYAADQWLSTGTRFQTPPLLKPTTYRACLKTGAGITSGGDICYEFRVAPTADTCVNECAAFDSLQTTASIVVDTSGGAVQLRLSASLAPEDQVGWDLGCDGKEDYRTEGNQALWLSNPPNAKQVCAVVTQALSTYPCRAYFSTAYDFKEKQQLCLCGDVGDQTMRGFGVAISSDGLVELTPRGDLSSRCDAVIWNMGDGNPFLSSRGRETVRYRYRNGAMFNVCMTVQRQDDTLKRGCMAMKMCQMVMLPQGRPDNVFQRAPQKPTRVVVQGHQLQTDLGAAFPAERTQLRLYDLNGRLLWQGKAEGERTVTELPSLPSSLYLWEVRGPEHGERFKVFLTQ